MRLAPLLPPLLLSLAFVAHADESAKLDKKELQELLDSTDEIAAIVSELRGLPVKNKIARGAMSREQITEVLLKKIDEEYKPGEIAEEARAWKRLGLLPEDADYKKMVVDLLTEQVAGFYDPDAKELRIADWIDAGEQRMVMAHEIDHALQDQAFDLDKLTKPAKDNGDLQLAHQALVEGDGMALMIEFTYREANLKQDPWADDRMVKMLGKAMAISGMSELDKAPLFLREQLIFPYAHGLAFVAAVRKTSPWSEVDAMFKALPESSEHILHPDKYRAKDKPVKVKLTANLPVLKGWKRTFENVLGELMWSVWLREHGVDADDAARAAEGWGGDRLVVFAPAGDDGTETRDLVAVVRSTWDAEMDAIEAFDACAAALQALTGAKAPDDKTETYTQYAGDGGDVSFVERQGSVVLVVTGAPSDKAAKLRKEAWTKWK